MPTLTAAHLTQLTPSTLLHSLQQPTPDARNAYIDQTTGALHI